MNPLKKNYVIYFSFYFVSQVLFVIIHVYLPIYFFNILNVNRKELAFIQIFSYLTLFSKPILSVYFDKKGTTSKRKKIIEIASLGVLVSFVFLIFNLELLLVFGVFLGLNFICMSLIDVCIDKTLLENSPTEKVKNNNTLFVRLGLMMGALFPILTFLVLFSNSYYIDSWALFFFISFFTIMPLLFIAPFISIDIEMPDNTSTLKDNDITDKINAKSIFCMCIFMFLLYALRLYEYPFEPWVLKKYFHGNYMYFSLFIFTMVIMNTLGLIIAGIVSHKHDRRKILMISVFLYGILTIIAPFTNLIMFLILASQIQFIAGFVLINSMMMTIDLSKKKVMYFQIIMSFAILANVVFIPLGTYLSIYIQTEFIAMLAGIIILFSLIPLIFITNR